MSGNHSIDTTSGSLGRHSRSDMDNEVIAGELLWPEWNLVEGPSARVDDPADGTDIFNLDKWNDGLAVKHKDKQRDLKYLSQAMKDYLQSDPTTDTSATKLRAALTETSARGYRDLKRIDFTDTYALWEKKDFRGRQQFRNAGRTRRNSVAPANKQMKSEGWDAVELT